MKMIVYDDEDLRATIEGILTLDKVSIVLCSIDDFCAIYIVQFQLDETVTIKVCANLTCNSFASEVTKRLYKNKYTITTNLSKDSTEVLLNSIFKTGEICV